MTEKVEINPDQNEEQILGDRTVQKTSNDAVISGDRKEHQKIYTVSKSLC